MIRIFASAFVLLFSITPFAKPLTAEQKLQIDSAVIGILKTSDVPSASIAVVTDGKLDYAKAYGDQRFDGTPAATTARYPFASISKQFTAAAILLLVEDGKMSLGDKVAKYLPTLTSAKSITVRQLLSHTSGYRDFWPQNYRFQAMTKPTTPQAILDRWAKAPLDFKPGTKYQYSNTGYTAAGLIAEMVAKEPLFAFEQRRIFKPLGMEVVQSTDSMSPADPVGSFRYALGPVRPIGPELAGWTFAAGDLAISPSELAKWNIARLKRMVLKPQSWQTQETNAIPAEAGRKYGLGVRIDAVGQHPRILHNGALTGYLSTNRVYPANGAAVTVAINAGFSNTQDAIADAIEAVILELQDDTAVALALFNMVRTGQIDRSRFTENAIFYFTPIALADYSRSLTPLGEVTSVVRRTPAALRGGLSSEEFIFTFASRKLLGILRTEPDSGRVEEFSLEPFTD